jgi:hypothetical protein
MDKLSVTTVLNLIEQMSYDDKQILIDKLTKKIFRIYNNYNHYTYVKANDEDEAIKLASTKYNFISKFDLEDVHIKLFCVGETGIGCEKIYGTFHMCYWCKEECWVKCYICNKYMRENDHFRIHNIDEIDNNILEKYIKKVYEIEETLEDLENLN